MKDRRTLIQEAVEDAIGTCSGLIQTVENYLFSNGLEIYVDDFTPEEMSILDEAFDCDDCGWIYESPSNGEGECLCDGCQKDREEEEDC